MVVSRSMPSLVMAGFRRRSANSSNPFCDSHISIIRNPVSVGWEICWYIPGSGRASTPISSSIARNSLWVKPVTFIVITTIFILFLFIFVLRYGGAVSLFWTGAAFVHPLFDFLDELRVADGRRASPFAGIPCPQHERVVVDVMN